MAGLPFKGFEKSGGGKNTNPMAGAIGRRIAKNKGPAGGKTELSPMNCSGAGQMVKPNSGNKFSSFLAGMAKK